MSSTAILFPGQGSATPGMDENVRRHRPDLVDAAHAAAGEDPFARPGESTRCDQIAILCASLAGFEALGRPDRDLMAGHSLGEISALVAAGAIGERDGLELVAERGRLMERVAHEAPGGMLALRASWEEAQALARDGVVVANDNAPRQVVLSGPDAVLAEIERAAGERGSRAKRLAVAGAFHAPAMEAAVVPFRERLEATEVREPAVPVYSCVTAAPFVDPRRQLAEALVSPVRWVGVVRALHAAGARRFVEVGPGKVLAGLVRRTLDDVEVAAAEQAEAARA